MTGMSLLYFTTEFPFESYTAQPLTPMEIPVCNIVCLSLNGY